MNSIFEWLIKLLVIVMLAPFLVSLAVSVAGAALVTLMPWIIGMAITIGAVAGLAAGLVLRRRLPPPPHRFPTGEVPRYRRPRGIRTDR